MLPKQCFDDQAMAPQQPLPVGQQALIAVHDLLPGATPCTIYCDGEQLYMFM